MPGPAPGSRRSNTVRQPMSAFWLLACLVASLLFAAGAPSPLYSVYQTMFRFPASTLTLIYAVYAFGALAALLVTGRVSDHLGRRLVTATGLVVQLAGMLAFIAADSVAWLFAARSLQGIGTGMALGAISAWLLDLQPTNRPRLGSVVTSSALLAGLGLGGLVASVLAEYAPDPLHLVFWLLTGFYAVALASLPLLPDPVQRRPGWLASLRPDIGVPAPAGRPFAFSAPSMIATWAVAGLYLSLGPSLAAVLLDTGSRIPGGLVIAALLGVAAVAAYVVRDADPEAVLVKGSVLLITGVAITLVAVATRYAPALYVGSFVAGLGFGPAFSGALRTLAPLAPANARGALLASIYVVVYLAFSVPTIVAGFVVPFLGLRETTLAYGLGVIALAAVTTVAVARQRTALADAR